MQILMLSLATDMEVPTVDMVRSSALIDRLLIKDCNVLCVGPTGSGKTLTISAKLSRDMPKKYVCDFVIFSARTSANQTQVYMYTYNTYAHRSVSFKYYIII